MPGCLESNLERLDAEILDKWRMQPIRSRSYPCCISRLWRLVVLLELHLSPLTFTSMEQGTRRKGWL